MKVDRPELVANIRNYLELNKAIDFVGIGRMEVTRASSFISGNDSHLLPPEYIYTISPGDSKLDFKFLKHYSGYFERFPIRLIYVKRKCRFQLKVSILKYFAPEKKAYIGNGVHFYRLNLKN